MKEKIEKLIEQYQRDIDKLMIEIEYERIHLNFNFMYHKSGQVKQLNRIIKELKASI